MMCVWTLGVPVLYGVQVFRRRSKLDPDAETLRARWLSGGGGDDEKPVETRVSPRGSLGTGRRLSARLSARASATFATAARRDSGFANALLGNPDDILKSQEKRAAESAARRVAAEADIRKLFEVYDAVRSTSLDEEDADRHAHAIRESIAAVSRAFDAASVTGGGIGHISFLWSSYRPHLFFWEIVESARRLVLEAVIIVILPDTAVQVAIACVISIGFLLALAYVRPYRDKKNNRLALFASTFVSVVLYVGLLIKTRSLSSSAGYDRAALGALLVTLNIGVVVAAVYCLLSERASYREWALKLKGAVTDKIPISPAMSARIQRMSVYLAPRKSNSNNVIADFELKDVRSNKSTDDDDDDDAPRVSAAALTDAAAYPERLSTVAVAANPLRHGDEPPDLEATPLEPDADLEGGARDRDPPGRPAAPEPAALAHERLV